MTKKVHAYIVVTQQGDKINREEPGEGEAQIH